jgi:hypothetical protein
MDSQVNQLARELSEAIAAAVKDDARVEACREKARAAGLDMRIALEAVIGFGRRTGSSSTKGSRKGGANAAAGAVRQPLEMSANDRRFLKSLRISADEPVEKQFE